MWKSRLTICLTVWHNVLSVKVTVQIIDVRHEEESLCWSCYWSESARVESYFKWCLGSNLFPPFPLKMAKSGFHDNFPPSNILREWIWFGSDNLTTKYTACYYLPTSPTVWFCFHARNYGFEFGWKRHFSGLDIRKILLFNKADYRNEGFRAREFVTILCGASLLYS